MKKIIKPEVEAYCLVEIEIHIWSDRKKKVFVPLLALMVLVRLTDLERNRVFDVV